eukprot:456528_1
MAKFTVFFVLFYLILKNSAEQIINKPASTLSCGTTEDCLIICNKPNSCQDSTFHIYNNIVNIECSGYQSCFRLNIIASNVKLLNFTVSASNGFDGGNLVSDNADDIIIHCQQQHGCDGNFNMKKSTSISIYCSAEKSCQFSTFYTEESSVTIECSATSSCYFSEIVVVNMTSVSLTLSEQYAFRNGFFSSKGNSKQIQVDCVAESGCYTSTFYYQAIQTVMHNCSGWLSCENVIIYALGPVAVDCVSYPSTACEDMEVIFPVNKTNYFLSSINISSPCFSSSGIHCIRIWTFYHMTPTINYIGGPLSDLYKVWVVYGDRFEHYCKLSDTECVANMEKMEDHHVLVWDAYYGEFGNYFDFRAFNAENNSILLILSDHKATSISGRTFTPPMLKNDAYLSIFCIFCNDVLFNFQSLQHVSMTYTSGNNYNAIERSVVLGPEKRFILNSFEYSEKNTYFLNHTTNIVINSIYGGTVYVANQRNISIHCGGMVGCSSSDIYSSLNPISTSIPATWDVVCSKSSNFHIHFPSINQTCTLLSHGLSNCGFLTHPPTFSPTTSPSESPTFVTSSPSHHPSNNPTIEPTNYPTTYPSINPTMDPTSYPTVSPTMHPSLSPTMDPTSDPTVLPTLNSTDVTQDNISHLKTQPNNHTILTLLVIVGVVILFCLGFIIVLYTINKRKRNQTMTMKDKTVELMSMDNNNDEENIVVDTITTNHQRLMNELKRLKSKTNIDEIDIIQVVDYHHQSLESHSIINNNLELCDSKNCPILQRNVMKSDITQKYDIYNTRKKMVESMHCYWCHKNDLKTNQSRMNKKYNQLYENNNDVENKYIFGSYFIYGDSSDEKQKHCDCIVVKAKYVDLKEEMTQNKYLDQIASSLLSNAQYKNEYEKAKAHWHSSWRKKKYSNISVDHLFALMIYCNFDDLSYEFSKTYRQSSGHQHSNFYHLGRLLKQAVLQHGTCIKDGVVKEFHHGVNRSLVPTEIVGKLGKGISIYCPLSTSASKTVAIRFTDNNKGIVMTFGGNE